MGNQEPVTILRSRGFERAAWRLIFVHSEDASPLEIVIEWSDEAPGKRAVVTCPGTARICVWAASLHITAKSLSTSDQEVQATIVDQYELTRNVTESGQLGTGAAQTYGIPPWARRVRVETATTASPPLSTIELVNGLGQVTTLRTLDTIPDGLEFGDASQVRVTVPVGVRYRLIFDLVL